MQIFLLHTKKQNLAEADMAVTETVAGLSLLGLRKYSDYGFRYESWLIIEDRVRPICLNFNQPLYHRKHTVDRNHAIFHLHLSSGLRSYEFPMAQYTPVTFKKKGLVNMISHMIHY